MSLQRPPRKSIQSARKNGNKQASRQFKTALEPLESRDLFYGLDNPNDTLPVLDASTSPVCYYAAETVLPAAGSPEAADVPTGTGSNPAPIDKRDGSVTFNRAADASGETPSTYAADATSQKIQSPKGSAYEQFGGAIAIDGDNAVVFSGGTGDVFLFQRTPEEWQYLKQLASVCAGTTPSPQIVAISGDTVVVGSPLGNGGLGEVFVYGRNHGGTNDWRLVKTVRAPDCHFGYPNHPDMRPMSPQFGFSVAVHADTIVVGAMAADDGQSPDDTAITGAVYVFSRHQGGTNNWGVVARLAPDELEHGDEFGFSVALSGTTIVVGAVTARGPLGEDSAGAAYVFGRDQGGNNHWGLVKKLVPSDSHRGAWFGRSVAINGDTIVVGADGDVHAGDYSGAAYVFSRHQGGTNQWGQIQKLIAPNDKPLDFFGRSVAIRGNTILAGALGTAHVFSRNHSGPTPWSLSNTIANSETEVSDLGVSVSVSGPMIAIGDAMDGGFDARFSGGVLLFDLRSKPAQAAATIPRDFRVAKIADPAFRSWVQPKGKSDCLAAQRIKEQNTASRTPSVGEILRGPTMPVKCGTSSPSLRGVSTSGESVARRRSTKKTDAAAVDRLMETDAEYSAGVTD